MTSKKIGPSPAQARVLVEMNRGSLVVMSDRGCRWLKGRGNSRVGKPRRATILSLERLGWVEVHDSATYLYRISEAGTAMAAGISDDILDTKPKLGMTVHFIVQSLKKRHPFPQWVLAEEIQLEHTDRIVDLLAISKKRVIAYEIKLTRADFLAELEDPTKRAPAMDWFSQFYFAAPTGLIKPIEIPTGCGLVEIFHNKNFLETKGAEERYLHTPDWPLVVSIGRSMGRR